jgi:hypothetical protein
MPLQLTRQLLLLRESMRMGAPGTERPYGPETASVASEGKKEERHFRQSHCHDPEMNAEAEGKSCRARSRRTSTRRGHTAGLCRCVYVCVRVRVRV